MPEHRVGFAQRFHNVQQLGTRNSERAREELALLAAVGEEFVQRRIEKTDRDW